MKSLARIIDSLRSVLAKRAGLLRVLALIGSALLVTAVTPNPAEACGITDIPSCIAMLFIKIFQLLTALMGWILVLEVDALIRVAQYHNFVSPGPSAVQIGWVVTRDLANMFFIVVLLIIAFGTILGSSTYHYEKNLPRLLIMAVVINFSKTICGIFIDMGQVVMLTFVNGFKEAAAGNFVNAFQISKLLALADGQNSYDFGLAVAMMFAFILAAIAVNVVLVMLVTMIFRIVMLWVLIILSPIAFLSSAIPKGGEHYAEWWKEFKKYIISGPIIAFFLWLALASVQHSGSGGLASEGFPASSTVAAGEQSAAGSVGGSQIPSEAGRTEVIMNLVIAICLMFAGLKFASSSGMVGLGVAKSIRDRATKMARGVAVAGGTAVGKRLAEPVMGGLGRGLAKVPLVGGLGRSMALKSEQWKKERQAKIEKFSGTPEDMARLSPSAFARKVGGLKDPKEIERYMKAAAANPEAMAALTAPAGALNPLRGRKESAAKDVIRNMIAGGDAAGAAKLISDNKIFGNMVKDDPELLNSTYQGLLDAAKSDPNKAKDVSAFEQKFASQIQAANPGMLDDKLKTLVPKMSSEDIAGLDKAGIAMMMGNFTPSQMKKVLQDGKPDQLEGVQTALAAMKAEDDKKIAAGQPDPSSIAKLFAKNGVGAGDISSSLYSNANVADYVLDRTRGDAKARAEVMSKGGKALSERADQRYKEAGTKEQILAALPDAISVGTLDAAKINDPNNPGLQSFIRDNAGQIDLASLSRNISVSDKGRSDAAKALTSLVGDVNPEKISSLRRGGMSEHIIPSAADMQAKAEVKRTAADATAAKAVAAQRDALVGEAAGLVSSLREQLEASARLEEAPGEARVAAERAQQQIVDKLDQLVKQRGNSAADIAKMTRDAEGLKSRGASQDVISGLERTIKGMTETLTKLDTDIAKTVANVKGVKFDAGDTGRKGKGNRA